jgi:hypothetical protein
MKPYVKLEITKITSAWCNEVVKTSYNRHCEERSDAAIQPTVIREKNCRHC